jgi:hypothetical protein
MRVGAPHVPIVLAAGALLIAAAFAVTLSHRPLVPIGLSRHTQPEGIAVVAANTRVCQANEVVPRGTTALRLALNTAIGPAVTVEATSGARLVTRGSVASGWRGRDVTVAVRRVERTSTHVELCMTIAPSSEPVGLLGESAAPANAATNAGAKLPGRVGVEYLKPGRRSWWSLVLPTARRMGLGRAGAGTWIALLVGALMAGAAAAASWLVLARPR